MAPANQIRRQPASEPETDDEHRRSDGDAADETSSAAASADDGEGQKQPGGHASRGSGTAAAAAAASAGRKRSRLGKKEAESNRPEVARHCRLTSPVWLKMITWIFFLAEAAVGRVGGEPSWAILDSWMSNT